MPKVDPNDTSVRFHKYLECNTKESIQEIRAWYYSGSPSGPEELRRFKVTLSDYQASWPYVENIWNIHSPLYISKKIEGLSSVVYRCTMNNNDKNGGKNSQPREKVYFLSR